jgi:uncharacterized protein GlcG (DUF336 family)
MKTFAMIGVVVMSVALAGVGDAQVMRVPYSNALTLDVATKCMGQALAESKKNNWNMAIAIVDSGSHLVAFERMDNTQIGSINIAIGKATTANNLRRPSKALEDAIGGGRHALLGVAGITPLEGGVPLVLDGKIMGAIGVSGETSAQDAQVARACADNIGK